MANLRGPKILADHGVQVALKSVRNCSFRKTIFRPSNRKQDHTGEGNYAKYLV